MKGWQRNQGEEIKIDIQMLHILNGLQRRINRYSHMNMTLVGEECHLHAQGVKDSIVLKVEMR
jgi:hypothetical protein